MCEKYNGWTNRETWAVNLHLSNDRGLYEMTRERVRSALDGTASSDTAVHVHEAGGAVQDFVDELTDPESELMPADHIIGFLTDVGSLYRVDWDEIGAAWLPESDES